LKPENINFADITIGILLDQQLPSLAIKVHNLCTFINCIQTLSDMKFLALIATIPALVLSSPHPRLPPDDPTPAPITDTWPSCQYTLSCSFAAIEKTSLATRLAYLRDMQKDRFGPVFNCGDQWRAIEGVIIFFQGKGLGEPGSWVSYTDAGIIEAIQRGGAIALGLSTETGGNPGSELWAKFMTDVKSGRLNDRLVRLRPMLGSSVTDFAILRRTISPGQQLNKPPPITERVWVTRIHQVQTSRPSAGSSSHKYSEQ
jgi:hypothetical protein